MATKEDRITTSQTPESASHQQTSARRRLKFRGRSTYSGHDLGARRGKPQYILTAPNIPWTGSFELAIHLWSDPWGHPRRTFFHPPTLEQFKRFKHNGFFINSLPGFFLSTCGV